MIIQCTKKLLNKLKFQPATKIPTTNPLFCWHANVLTFNRKSTVVFVNDSNRYIIVLHGMYVKDLRRINDTFTEAIRIIFRKEQISPTLIEQYLQQAPPFTYTKTKDRTSVARMNTSIDAIHYMLDYLDDTKIIQPALSLKMSDQLITHGDKDYIWPNEQLHKDFNDFYTTNKN